MTSRMTGDDDGYAAMRRRLGRRDFLGLAGAAGLAVFLGRSSSYGPEEFLERTVESPRPTFDPRTYRLAVDGLVRRPLSFTYGGLLWLPSAKQTCDFLCIEGWGVEDVPWEGLRLTTLMTLARPLPEAQFVTFHCLGDVYTESLTLEQAQHPNALLAYRMYGNPLPPERGSPVRLVFPRMLGYKGAKWVTRVEFRAERDLGYWAGFGAPLDPWLEDERPCSIGCGDGLPPCQPWPRAKPPKGEAPRLPPLWRPPNTWRWR